MGLISFPWSSIKSHLQNKLLTIISEITKPIAWFSIFIKELK